MKATILVCDDEAPVRFTLTEALEPVGYTVLSAASVQEALPQLVLCDVVITDLRMPGQDGIVLLTEARSIDPDLPVVMLTAHGSERTAVQAMKLGAYDYLTKPFVLDDLRAVVARAVEAHSLRRAARQLVTERAMGHALVGESSVFKRFLDDARRVARKEIPVLLRGETGTGKELIATLLHTESPRRDGACVRFNCAALPAELAESELFGHTRGAFTGATTAHRGYFSQAHEGTLVLDEVGELPMSVQAKLLRALQLGEIHPLGAAQVEKVDVRVIASTHRDLLTAVREGTFREDLYYRLAVVELVVPPLRDRREDIPALADHFRRRYAARFDLNDVRFDKSLIAGLTERPWPGNIRELENAIARILALCEGGTLTSQCITRLDAPVSKENNVPQGLREALDAFEHDLLSRTLKTCDGNQSETARRLNVSRMTLLDKLKRHGLR
jgi:DNA-binding NtrC family response regulator